MKRKILSLFIMLLILSACAPEQVEPPSETAAATVPAAALNDLAAAETALPTAVPLPTSVPATSSPAAEAVDNKSTITAEPPTLTPLPSPTAESEQVQVISGQTADGAFFLGAADAPLTIIDYSDFL